jgi:hypothetical protein
MLIAGAWQRSQQNLITFVLVDANGNGVRQWLYIAD